MGSTTKILTIALVCASALVSAQAQTEVSDSAEFPLVPEDALAEALMGIKLTLSDLPFRTDFVEPDSFRLPIIDSLTLDPLGMIGFANDVSVRLFADAEQSLYWLLQFETAGAAQITDPGQILSGDMTVPTGHKGASLESPPFTSENACLKKCIEVRLPKLVDLIYQTSNCLKAEIDSFLAVLDIQELAFIRDTLPELLLEDVNDEFRSVEELDSIQKREEEFAKRFIPMATELVSDRTGWEELKWRAAGFLALMSDSARSIVKQISEECDCGKGGFQFETATPEGTIAVGGYGKNHYVGRHIYILDLGGDDRYDIDRANAPQYILDVSGDDQYTSLTDFAIASGFIYPSFLIDLEGDDIYSGKNFSLGSGLFSIGMLVDESGNDRYFGDTHTQGAGSFGIGMLVDKSGSDTYDCALFGQAFAYVRGLGVLCDISGNDFYFAGGKYKDVLRYKDHYLSLSQGFAYGHRPHMSGGIAILADSSGHDIYVSDIFGQGSSYWYGLGIQTDFAGNDKYLSFQYAQGVGTHLTLGILMDKTGDDYYLSKGVSQGCGHDLAAGILVDYFGNDTYQAYDLSQGAGSANGFGWLVDYRGDDSYQIKGRHNSQGYGNPRRDYGSIGLLMDLMGRDEYIGNGADQSIWIIDSKWGIGVDLDYWSIDSTGVAKE